MSDFAGRTLRNLKQMHDDPEWCIKTTSATGYCSCPEDPTEVDRADEAELICSDIRNSDGLAHRPVIDLDLECQLVPSATPGHHHLYIDKTMSKSDFEMLLDVMWRVGLVERGYLDSFRRRGYSAVRHPDKPKVLDK